MSPDVAETSPLMVISGFRPEDRLRLTQVVDFSDLTIQGIEGGYKK